MPITSKHSTRIPDEIWLAAVDRAEEIARLGVKGDYGPYSVADMIRTDLARCENETVIETMQRLGVIFE